MKGLFLYYFLFFFFLTISTMGTAAKRLTEATMNKLNPGIPASGVAVTVIVMLAEAKIIDVAALAV